MLFEVLDRVASELPGCQLTSIVSLESGLSLACVARDGNDHAAAADAYHSNLYRLVRNALAELGDVSPIDDVVIVGTRRVFVSRPLGTSGYFWHVSTSVETTLGFTQAVMRKYQGEVQKGIEDLLAS